MDLPVVGEGYDGNDDDGETDLPCLDDLDEAFGGQYSPTYSDFGRRMQNFVMRHPYDHDSLKTHSYYVNKRMKDNHEQSKV